MNNIGSYLVFHLLLIEENTGHPLIILICHKVGLPFSLLLISIHQNLDSFLIHFFCGLFIYSDTLAKSIIMNKISMMQLSLSMYILKDTCIFYLYLICIMKILLYCKDPHVLFISQGGQFALKKNSTARIHIYLSAKGDNLLSGWIDCLPWLEKPLPIIQMNSNKVCRPHWPTCTHPQSPPAASSSHCTPPLGSSAPVSAYLSSLSTVWTANLLLFQVVPVNIKSW